MARYSFSNISAGSIGWDAILNDAFSNIFNEPFACFNYSGSPANLETNYPAADHTDSFAILTDTSDSNIRKLYFSDDAGTPTWTYVLALDGSDQGGGGGGGLPDYSTSEQDTGRDWHDGKDIYVKTIDCGTMPNNTNKNVAHGITVTNGFRLIDIEAVTRYPGGTDDPSIPFAGSFARADSTTEDIEVRVTDTNIFIRTDFDFSDYDESWVTIYYLKDADA